MNIFVLDKDPHLAALCLCDKHIPKMVTESAQLLASALVNNKCPRKLMPLTKSGTPYSGGYNNHPCAKWASESRGNFMWLTCHAMSLVMEFMERYDKLHACTEPILQMGSLIAYIPSGAVTPFVQAMPPEYKSNCAVESYRNYYIAEKSFAKWEKGRQVPVWYDN